MDASFTARLKAGLEAALDDGLRTSRSVGQAVALSCVSRALTGAAFPPELIEVVMRRLRLCSGAAETIELQVALRDYDPQRDKRFAGNIRLPHVVRPRLRICVLGDAHLCAKASELGLESRTADALRNFNRNKRLLRKFGKRFRHFVASESIIRRIPHWLSCNGKAYGSFPTFVQRSEDLAPKIEQIKSTVKFQLKKRPVQNLAVGHCGMRPRELQENAQVAINFLLSLLKRGTRNIQALHVKSTMGPPHRLV